MYKSYQSTSTRWAHTPRSFSYAQYNFVDAVIKDLQRIFSTRIHLDDLQVFSGPLYRPKQFVTRASVAFHKLFRSHSSRRQHQISPETCGFHSLNILSVHIVIRTVSLQQPYVSHARFGWSHSCFQVFHIFACLTFRACFLLSTSHNIFQNSSGVITEAFIFKIMPIPMSISLLNSPVFLDS